MCGGVVGRPGDGDGLLLMGVDAKRQARRAFDFQAARGRVGFGSRSVRHRGLKPAFCQAERIPTQPEAMAKRQHDKDRQANGQSPGERRQAANDAEHPHGNTRRSSSK